MDVDAPDPKAERPPKRRRDILDIVNAAVLSTAALLTAFASYQADLWDGEQAELFTEANALQVQSSRAAITAGQLEGADMMAFGAWLSAYATHNGELDEFYRERFRPAFATVFEEWMASRPLLNPHAPNTPFDMPGYRIPERATANALYQQAYETFESGQRANEQSDAFVLATVILANALFFGGIGQVSADKTARKGLLAIAGISVLAGFAYVMTLPLAP